jgi:hypothetical protein
MRRKPLALVVAALGLALLAVPFARGAVLAQYNFSTIGNVENLTGVGDGFQAQVVAPGITATNMTDGSPGGALIIEASKAATAPPDAPFFRVDRATIAATSAASAVANGAFATFTITPAAEMDLTDLQFDVMRGGGATPRGYVVRSSADNFATDLSTADLLTARPTYTHITVPLTGASFQDLTAPIEFRLYVYAPAAGNSVDWDNITLNGTVVPEPAGLTALSLAATGILARRRRR